MTSPQTVRPTTANAIKFPLLASIGATGLPSIVEWSATRLGPHYQLRFDALGLDDLHLRAIGTEEQLLIGKYTIANPYNTSSSEILLSLTDGGIDVLMPNVATPIKLASSMPKLASALFAFHTLHMRLLALKPKDGGVTEWNAFAEELQKIDQMSLENPYSYWGNMIEERTTMS